MTTKQSLLQLLADNELHSLFEELKSRQGHYNDLVLLESQWKDLQSRQRSGTISDEQANLEAARVRKNLLELIELSFSERRKPPIGNEPTAHPPHAGNPLFSLRAVIFGGAASLVVLLIFLLFPMLEPAAEKAGQHDESGKAAASTSLRKPAKTRTLNISEAEPMTFRPGDFQYERVYSVIEGKVESVGGGKNLITLKVGLDFKGIINFVLSDDDFRLVAAELRGPLAPANFLSELIDSKSYGEGEVKFELSDAVHRFSIILEGKEDRKWNFTIE